MRPELPLSALPFRLKPQLELTVAVAAKPPPQTVVRGFALKSSPKGCAINCEDARICDCTWRTTSSRPGVFNQCHCRGLQGSDTDFCLCGAPSRRQSLNNVIRARNNGDCGMVNPSASFGVVPAAEMAGPDPAHPFARAFVHALRENRPHELRDRRFQLASSPRCIRVLPCFG